MCVIFEIITIVIIQAIHRAIVHENEQHIAYFKSAQRFVGIRAEVKHQGKVRIQYETCYKGMIQLE